MEKVIRNEQGLLRALLSALVIVAVACAMVVITYGMESVVSGAHDAFHDFRHTIGMPCH